MTANGFIAIALIVFILVFAFVWDRVVRYDRFQDWLKRIANK